ncbi:MAG TPA: YcxB family protein [Verrucomicrobiota bacterium]|jgi:hypothetical protein|nr:hypothetical protein [Verrucomicrobiota bacterium]OQB90340.1 MAG: hypothetical protein BWX84_01956 [Verrucomicrobia bacterium ADurb.Bin118]HPY29707.1 YcxB family protein [Verrucomicrobiota bacterium]HQB15486.1 YcxB family protein [Verrucomicrobiota bacterium]
MEAIEYKAEVSYPKRVLDQAGKFAWSRRPYRRMDLAISVLLAASCIFPTSIGQETRGWQAVLVSAILVGLFWCLRWYQYRKTLAKMRQRFAAFPDRKLRFVFTRDSIAISSKYFEGTFEMTTPWKAFAEVWMSPEFLLLLTVEKHYVLLPTSQLDEECRKFIMTRIGEERAANPNFKLRT